MGLNRVRNDTFLHFSAAVLPVEKSQKMLSNSESSETYRPMQSWLTPISHGCWDEMMKEMLD